MIDLSPAHLSIVERILAEHVPECEVRAFGSRATWNAKDYSDLDLAVVGERRLPRGSVARLKEAFEGSRLPMRVDVVDWHAISEGFREAIKSECVVVQQAAASSADWREIPLSDVAHIVMGQSPPGDRVSSDADIPLLNGPTEFGPHHPDPVQFTTDGRKRARPGDILFCVRGSTTGRMNWADREYAIGRGVAAIRHIEGRDLQPMLRGVIEHHLPDLLAQATGSTFPNVSAKQLAAIPYPDIGLDEQRAIARVLGALDDRIELNRRMSETLEEMARALFRSWFVDFDPVREKAEGRPSGLPPDLDALFPASFEASELGEIPAGWEVTALGDVIDVNPRRQIRRGDVATHVEMAALPTSGPHVSYWTERPFTSGSRFTRGDTLLARITPSLENGKTAFIDFLDNGETGWGSTEFIVLRPKPPWPPEIAYVMAREPDFREHAIVNMTGTSGRQRVPAEAVSDYLLAAPPVGAAAAFGAFVRPWFERSTHLSRQSRALAKQRDALLPRLVSGDMRVAASTEE